MTDVPAPTADEHEEELGTGEPDEALPTLDDDGDFADDLGTDDGSPGDLQVDPFDDEPSDDGGGFDALDVGELLADLDGDPDDGDPDAIDEGEAIDLPRGDDILADDGDEGPDGEVLHLPDETGEIEGADDLDVEGIDEPLAPAPTDDQDGTAARS